MLLSSIPHVDGAFLWLPYFVIVVYIYVCKIIAFVNFQEIKEIFILILFIYYLFLSMR